MRRIAFVAILTLLTVSMIAAQQATPTPEPVACTPDDLRTYYDGLVAEALAAFDAVPAATSVPDQSLLAVLYAAGESLQARMLACGYIPDDIESLPVGADTPLARVLEVLDTLTPNPLRGQLLYLGEEPSAANQVLGCAGCHEGGMVGPATEGTWTRWDEQHSALPEYADEPFEYYAVESILHPNAYVAAPYMENLMPSFYGGALSYQDLADIVSFLASQDQLLDE